MHFDFTPAAVRKSARTYDFTPAVLRAVTKRAASAERRVRATNLFRKRIFSDDRRKTDAKSGAAMPGGRYPIESAKDLHNAYLDYIRTGRSSEVASHINERAKALGVDSPIGKALHVEIDFAKAKENTPDLKDGLCWGWTSIIEKDGKVITDHDGDRISEDELMKAAHNFLSTPRTGGAMHIYDPDTNEPLKAGEIVESMVFTKDIQKALGIDLGKVGWLVGYRIEDPTIRKAIASGKLRAFSCGGSGLRIPVSD
jgi:hypothetical protein